MGYIDLAAHARFKWDMEFNTLTHKITFAFLTFIVSTAAFAHGEDKPGPHGGFIRMPGAFHTEVVPVGTNSIKVFLLDMNWKNPVVANSQVVVTRGPANAKCDPKADHFVCTFNKEIDLTKSGRLDVRAKREKAQGSVATYDLPLSHTGH